VIAKTSTDPHIEHALETINHDREAHGLPDLTIDVTLCDLALHHAEDEATVCVDDVTVLIQHEDVDFNNGDTGGAVAECESALLEVGGDEDATFDQIEITMISEGFPAPGTENDFYHLLDPDCTSIGIGLFVDANGDLWVSEMFEVATVVTDVHLVHALDTINHDRIAAGLAPLVLDAKLCDVALHHAEDEYEFCGGDVTLITQYENEDFNAGDTGGAVEESDAALLITTDEDSTFDYVEHTSIVDTTSTYYVHVMDVNVTHVGIGLYVDANGDLWVTEEFE
jgi:hypothetical protein